MQSGGIQPVSLTNSVFSFLPKDTLVCRLTTKALLFAYLSTLGKGVPFIPLKWFFFYVNIGWCCILCVNIIMCCIIETLF